MHAIRCVYCRCVLGEAQSKDLVANIQVHFDLTCHRPIAITGTQAM